METSRQAPPDASADSREKILEVAQALFARSGFQGVGMRQLAASTGLSKSALFHHFPTKLALYEEVLDRVLERLELGLERARAAAPVPAAAPAPAAALVQRLDGWVDAVVRTLAEDQQAARLLMRTLGEDDPIPNLVLALDGARQMLAYEKRLARILDRFVSLLEEGIAAGVFRPVSIADAIQSVIGTLVFHFASGDFGEALLGESIFSAAAVERRSREVAVFIRRGLLA